MDTLFPNIPRILTAFAESSACLVMILSISSQKQQYWFLRFIVCALIQIVLQVAVESWPVSLWFLGMAVNIVWMFVTLSFTTKQPPVNNIYATLRAFLFAEFSASFSWLVSLYILWSKSLIITAEIIVSTGILLLLSNSVFLFMLKRANVRTDLVVSKKDLWMTFFTSLIIFLMSNIGFALSSTNYQLGDTASIYIFRTMTDVLGIAILFIQDSQRREIFLKNELQAINYTLYYQHREYLHYRLNSQNIERKVHDLKHQLELLNSFEGESEFKDKLIHDIKSSILKHDTHIEANNPILNAVLTQKNLICLNNEISLSCMVDGEDLTFMDAMDLYSLLGNALDNAIESVLNLPVEKRAINLRIYTKNRFLIVFLENPFSGNIQYKEGYPKTTKEDTDYHGYGIKSMQYIVDKYKGNLSIETENNWFKLKLLFPIHAS